MPPNDEHFLDLRSNDNLKICEALDQGGWSKKLKDCCF